MPGGVLAFADVVDGGVDVLFHRLVLVVVGGLDRGMHMLQRLDALAVLVVPRVFEIVVRLLEVGNRMLGMFCLFELRDGLVHFGLRGVRDGLTGSRAGSRGACAGSAAKCGGAEGGEDGFDGCCHDVFFGWRMEMDRRCKPSRRRKVVRKLRGIFFDMNEMRPPRPVPEPRAIRGPRHAAQCHIPLVARSGVHLVSAR